MNTGTRGDAALLLASSKLVEAGITLLKPVSESLDFDLVAYDGITFSRLQVKRAYNTLAVDKFVISLRRITMTSKGAKTKKYSINDTDFIIGVVMETSSIYCIPTSIIVGRTSVTLNPHNIQSQFISNKKSLNVEPYKNVLSLNNKIYTL